MSSDDQHKPGVDGTEAHNRTVEEGTFRYGLDRNGRMQMEIQEDGVMKVVDMGFDYSDTVSALSSQTPTLPEDVVRELEELRKVKEVADPLLALSTKDSFKEWLDDQVESGEIPDPNPPPRVEAEDVAGYMRRQEDPQAERVLEAMRQYASHLSDKDRELLEANHTIFNQTWDRFRDALGDAPVPRGGYANLDATVTERNIARKEALKSTGRVESTGYAPHEVPLDARSRRVDAIRRAKAEGSVSKQEDLDYALGVALFGGEK